MSNRYKNITLIGYSGHAYVVCDILESMKNKVTAYCDQEEKNINPYNLTYLGSETQDTIQVQINRLHYFIAIGDNHIRGKIYNYITPKIGEPINAIHSSTILSKKIDFQNGTMIAPGVCINSMSKIGCGVICNTGCTIDHECIIGNFVHIGPNAVLCGNVTIGEYSFVGANAVIKQGVIIGKNVTIGAGSVVIENIPDNYIVAGNPAKLLNIK